MPVMSMGTANPVTSACAPPDVGAAQDKLQKAPAPPLPVVAPLLDVAPLPLAVLPLLAGPLAPVPFAAPLGLSSREPYASKSTPAIWAQLAIPPIRAAGHPSATTAAVGPPMPRRVYTSHI